MRLLERPCRRSVQASFDSGVRKVTEAMKRLPMEVLDESAWKRFDSDGRLFWNMNTPADLRRSAPHSGDRESMSEELHQAGLTSASSGQGAAEYYFEFRDVCKAFDERVVLKNVSFKVKRGETCVIMGRSGVGKSVSLKHIMGFLHADSGRVFIDGVDVTDFTERQFEEIRRKVTMVFQSGALFDSLTVAENIAFPLRRPARP